MRVYIKFDVKMKMQGWLVEL